MTKFSTSLLLLLGLATGFSCSSTSEQPARAESKADSGPMTWSPQDVEALRSVTSAVISPDGKRVAYTLAVPRRAWVEDDGAPYVELHVLDMASGNTRAYIEGKVNISGVAWMPDSKAIAYLAKRGDDKETCLYAIPADGGESRKVASLGTSISSFSLSGDGKEVALVANEPKSEAVKKREEKGFKQIVYEEDGALTKVWIASTRDGAGEPRKLEIEGDVHQCVWSPVDARLALAVAPTPLVDDQYMQTRVRVVDSKDGTVLHKIENPGKLGQIGWSPDAKWVAMIQASDLHDPAATTFIAWASDPSSGTGQISPFPGDDWKGAAVAFDYQPDGHALVVAAYGCETAYEKVNVGNVGEQKTLIPTGIAIWTNASLSADGQTAALVGHTPEHPPEVWTMKHGDAGPKRRTISNEELEAMPFAKQEVITWKARDGLELEGVLVRPANEQKGQRYPLILSVHGGPEAHDSNGWVTNYSRPGQIAAARGFAVLYPNYRGSTGRGVAFQKSSQGDPAGKEFNDLVDAVDHLVASGLVDKTKVGITGGSYGGYATAWCSTYFTDTFAAGVMFVGIADKFSKFGTTDIPNEEFYVHALHRVWDDPAFMQERSPITYAAQSHTPLLILHGKDDPRVDPGQSRTMYRHLKLRGKAPVRLVLYPGEGHGNRKAAARLDYAVRMLQWFEHYLKGPGGAMPAYEVEYEEATAKS